MKKFLQYSLITAAIISPMIVISCTTANSRKRMERELENEYQKILNHTLKINTLFDLRLAKHVTYKDDADNGIALQNEDANFKKVDLPSDFNIEGRTKPEVFYPLPNTSITHDEYPMSSLLFDPINDTNNTDVLFYFINNGEDIFERMLREPKRSERDFIKHFMPIMEYLTNYKREQLPELSKKIKLDKNKNYVLVIQPQLSFDYERIIKPNTSKSEVGLYDNKISIVQNLDLQPLYLSPSQALRSTYAYKVNLNFHFLEVKNPQITQENFKDYISKERYQKINVEKNIFLSSYEENSKFFMWKYRNSHELLSFIFKHKR
ncbi:hypothetical protein HGG64_00950 [Mycoplasma phocoeninasale]|uniref:Lipoprotein n=1 Tax=Mycoplasma phocoeninasale TaxID=2726117 RepID=A0A858U2V3_9MOLU|nr:hypothetical protein [Mycoplasma phocoeninasale]QJG66281.1 hypothetical protein HGG64_00950 [Mycoplasma phocoeninasale]